MTVTIGRSLVGQLLQHRFGVLLCALLVTLALPPLAAVGGPVFRFLFTIMVTAVLLSGLLAVSTEKRTFYVGLAIVIPAALLAVASRVTLDVNLEVGGDILAVLFLLYLTWKILAYVLRAERVDTNTLFAAVCIYLLIGFICAVGFSVLELLNDSPLRYPSDLMTGPLAREALTTYYSFVTLTTLGYGDISPVSTAARSLAILEAVTGQLVIVVLIARLVGLTTAQMRSERSIETRS